MEQPSKRAQFVHGMRAYSAHNRLHVNAPTPCRFSQSYIIGGARFGGSPWRRTARILRERIGPSGRAASTPLGGVACDAHRRTRPLSRSATPVPSPARGPTTKMGIGVEAGTQFVPGTRAYSAHNRLHVNAPAPCRFAQSYIIDDPFGATINSHISDGPSTEAMQGGCDPRQEHAVAAPAHSRRMKIREKPGCGMVPAQKEFVARPTSSASDLASAITSP
jgi:hypothetical protein